MKTTGSKGWLGPVLRGALGLLLGLGSLLGGHGGEGQCPAPGARFPAGSARREPGTVPGRRTSQIPGFRSGESTNWAGYALTGTGFTLAQANWTVPAAGPGSCFETYSSTWVGIDGFNSGTVEQLGTEQDWDARRGASYYAWYEMFPQGGYYIPFPIAPGDRITAAVQYVGSGWFSLSMSDAGRNSWHWGISQRSPAARLTSVEWIEEAPVAGSILPLANFHAVTFAPSYVGHPDSSYLPITMGGRGTGNILAYPTGSFSIVWEHCR